jgi:hypothetical protein
MTNAVSVAPPTLAPAVPHTRARLVARATTKVSGIASAKRSLAIVPSAIAAAQESVTAAIVIARARYGPPRSASAPLNPPRLIHVAPPVPNTCASSSGTTVATAARSPAAYAGRDGARVVAARTACSVGASRRFMRPSYSAGALGALAPDATRRIFLRDEPCPSAFGAARA